jgi:predicted ATPase
MKSVNTKHFVLELALARQAVPSFKEYPFNLPAVAKLDRLEFHPKVTFFVGENGSGKSTLLEAIAVKLGMNAEGGGKNFNFTTRSSHSPLHEYIALRNGIKRPRDSYFLRAESFFNVATKIEELDAVPSPAPPIIRSYGGQSLHEQSHGESFLALFLNRLGERGIYLFDEPEAALSPTRQMTLLARLHELANKGSQFIIATHSPIVMAYPDAWIFLLGRNGPERVKYEDTEHYSVMRAFMLRREQMLDRLCKPVQPEPDEPREEPNLFTADDDDENDDDAPQTSPIS